MGSSVVLVEADFIAYANYLINDYAKMGHDNGFDIEFELGNKYIRVVHVSGDGSRSSNSFIERSTGDILKCNTWKSPAKNFPRGNLLRKDYSRCKWNGCF